MQKKKTERFGLFRAWVFLLIPVIFLTSLGLLALISAAATSNDSLLHFAKQAQWLSLAVFTALIVAFLDLEILKKCLWLILLVTIAMLVIVLLPQVGELVKGARRWIKIGAYTLQPSEFSKITLVITMAYYLQKNQRHIKTFFKGFLFPMCIIAVFAGLILLEPDYGTSALCIMVSLSLLFLAGTRIRYLLIATLFGVALFGYKIQQDPTRWDRIVSFADSEANKLDGGFQVNQSKMSFGAGGISGAGIGQGSQQQCLPERHTDFIFAVVGEELGLIITISVVFAFFFMFIYICSKLKHSQNSFELYLAIGSSLMISLQAIFNMGVVTGLFPTKGISLPFMSYGGSNLVVMFIFIGLILNCLRRWRNPQLLKAKEL